MHWSRKLAVRPLWLWLFAITLSAALFAWVVWSSPSTRIPIGNGRELRILAVTFGREHRYSTEHVLKQLARRLLPVNLQGPLGPLREHRAKTLHDTLILWVVETGSAGKPVRPSITGVETLFTDGVSAPGQLAEDSSRQLRIEFRSYARDRQRLTFRVHNSSGEAAQFTVANPTIVPKARYHARALPITNAAHPLQIVFRSVHPRPPYSEPRASISVMSLNRNAPARHWTEWQLTTFDEFGNWSGGTKAASAMPILPLLPNSNSVWRVQAYGTDYISAGFIAQPETNTWQALKPPINGLDLLLVAGPGRYMLSNNAVSALAPAPGKPQLLSTRSHSVLEFGAEGPGILLVSKEHMGLFSARIRERLPNNRGRIFRSRGSAGVTSAGLSASFIPIGLPTVATNLELEVMRTVATTFDFNPREINRP